MTTSKLNRAALVFGTAGVLAATLTLAMTPALGASAPVSAKSHTAAGRALIYSANLRYIVGSDVAVPANSAGSAATQCPTGMYPIGGGPSSSSSAWTLQWSDPDRSSSSLAHPNEWTVGLFNTSSSAQLLKVFVVCSTAQKVTQNY
jgi:hypothetical protein